MWSQRLSQAIKREQKGCPMKTGSPFEGRLIKIETTLWLEFPKGEKDTADQN